MSANHKARRRLLACGVLAALCYALSVLISAASANASGSVVVQYYYQNPCASCDEAGEFRAFFDHTVGAAGTQVQVLTYNTFQLHSDEVYRKACDQLGIPREQRLLPMVVISGKYLTGKVEIETGLWALFLDRRMPASSDHSQAGFLGDALIGLLRGVLLCAAALCLIASVRPWPAHSVR